MTDPALLFASEYDRLNRDVYAGALPVFPGVMLTDRQDIFSATNTRGEGATRRLEPFLLSTHVKGALDVVPESDAEKPWPAGHGDLLLEAIRHEVAHAAALLFDEDEGHGPAWREHARRCGASELATLDAGHPLRVDWPTR